ncbi:MAG: membrane protein insertase YidC [Pseudomonadales bacterium]|nr:membrane protein insertase YidC [Pseudomonadales bacterium]
MDKIRIVLIAAIAMLSFMLIIEFAKFRDNKNKESLMAKQEQSFAPANTSIPSPTSNTVDDGELPSAHDDVAIEQEMPTAISNDLISAETDTLIFKINPIGGDIVYVALRQQLARIDTPDIPFVLLEDSSSRTYIAASGLVGKNGTDSAEGRPHFSSVQSNYVLADGSDELVVTLAFMQNQVEISKRFTFKRDSYLVDVDYLINNQSAENWQAAFYAQIKRDDTVDDAGDGGMGMAPYLGFATHTLEDRFKKIDFDDVKDKAFPATTIEGGWIAMIQHYFLSAWIADPATQNTYSTVRTKSGFNIARVKSPVTTVAAGEQGQIHASFYAGPKDQYTLEEISEGLDLSVDYGFLWMIAQPLYALLHMFNEGILHIYGYTFDLGFSFGNWGFSIIALTIFVKACFFSLNAKAYKSMAKMRAIQPKMLALKDQYGDDRQKMSQETMALYKKEGVNPIGGCLPMLVQMPVFIALYWVLLESVELRHAPFIGYIHDLSAMDPYFIMPLIMGVSMYFQQKLNPPPPDPMQAKIMQFLPVIFTFFFLFFPSGLVLYWVVNNILTIIQQSYITRKIEAQTK